MWGQYLTKLKNGFSGIGKSKVNTNNQIIPDLEFQHQRFKGGVVKRFGEYNTIILEEEEKEVILREPVGKGAIYIHGSNTPYYSGDIVYNKTTERFSATFDQIDYPVFSDCIIFKRISTDKSQVGRIYGSHPNGRVRDYNPVTIPQGVVYTRRFEYQSITKSSLDQESAYRRDKQYYSKVFKDLYEIGRPFEFEKKLCCNTCKKYYYTGNFKSANESPCLALIESSNKIDETKAGNFYTIDSYKRQVTNPHHSQYIKSEDFNQYKNAKLIRFNEVDITKYDYDYRILYYPNKHFWPLKINGYQGSLKFNFNIYTFGTGQNNNGLTVKDFVEKNTFFYNSYGGLITYFSNSANATTISDINTDTTIKINQTVRHFEQYYWKAVSWHNSTGANYKYNGYDDSIIGTQYTGSKIATSFWGDYKTDKGDIIEIDCDYGWYAGVVHGGGDWGIGTSSGKAHRYHCFVTIHLKYVNNLANYYDQIRGNGEFITDLANSDKMSDDELAENGITPKDDKTTTEEEKTESFVSGYATNPFFITSLTNYSSKNIELEIYTPHVFTNIIQYELIGDDEERLISKSDSPLVEWEKPVLKEKAADGSGKAVDSGGFVKVNGFDFSSFYENAYYFVQKYVKKKVFFSDKATGTREFYDGYEKKYYKEEDVYRPEGNYAKMNELFHSQKGDSNKSAYGYSGEEITEVNQRVSSLNSCKYHFFALGAYSGWASSIFNKYIFFDYLEQKGELIDIYGDTSDDNDDNDGSSSTNNGLLYKDGFTYKEFNTFIEYKENLMSPLWRELTEEEKYYAYDSWRKQFTLTSRSFVVRKKTVTSKCSSLLDIENDRDPGDGNYCFGNNTYSAGKRPIDNDEAWEKTDSWYSEKYGGEWYEKWGIVIKPYGEKTYDDEETKPWEKGLDFVGTDGTDGKNKDDDKKNKKQFSAVFNNVDIPGEYIMEFSNLDKVSSSYAEYRMYVTRKKGKLLTSYNASPKILRPWAGNIVTVAGCCPIRAKNKYFIFDNSRYSDKYQTISKKPWAPIENSPDMQNRFFGSGATYINYLGEGVYPHTDGDKFLIVSTWFSDIDEGFSGIELKFKYLTNLAQGKCTTGFNTPCDTALVCSYNIAGPLVEAHNIFSEDTNNAKYKTNKGVFPIIKGLWQPDKENKKLKNIEWVLFMIETQCMIEGPNYFFTTSKSELPAGFEKSYVGYKSRGLMVAIKYKGSKTPEQKVIDSETTGFFNYFKKQNEKRDKINFRRAYDPMPRSMTGKQGYYYDCEEAFGLYEISSPFAYETQLAAKMSFTVRVGDDTAVLFMLAYDIDKWPANVDSDNPTNDKQFPEILIDEEYSFKAVYLPFTISMSGVVPEGKFTNFTMQYCLRDLTTRKSKSDRSLEKEGYEYFTEGKKTYHGIIVVKDNTSKKGYKLLPQYVYDTKKDKTNQVKRGVVRLVRWRTMEWECPKTTDDYTIKYDKDDEVTLEKYEGAIAQLAVSFDRPLSEYVDQYYVGQTVLVLFYRKIGTTKLYVENLFIPKQMVWLKDESNNEQIASGIHTYDKKLVDIASLGMIDTIIIKKKNTKTKKSNRYSNLFTSRDKDDDDATFEILGIPVISTDNQTYLAVTKDCKFWEIAGKVGSGKQVHLTAEFMENKQDDE